MKNRIWMEKKAENEMKFRAGFSCFDPREQRPTSGRVENMVLKRGI